MTPLFKKLNYKDQEPIIILNAPESFAAEIQQMEPLTAILSDEAAVVPASFIMAFVTRQTEVDHFARLLTPLLQGDGILWFCYPKGSSKKYTCDFNRDTGWDVVAQSGMEPVRMVAIDGDWSALRFRKVQHIKTMTRSFARSEAGKEKVQAKKQA
jgi:hypothetical protein